MNIAKFAAAPVAEHIKRNCALTPLEQLSIIRNSQRQPLSVKLAACKKLLGECGGDKEAAKYVRRSIAQIDKFLAAATVPAKQGIIFVATAHLEEYYERSSVLDNGRYDPFEERAYFSTFAKAKRWFARELREYKADSDAPHVLAYLRVTEKRIDTNRRLTWYQIDDKLRVIFAEDLTEKYRERRPENCYVYMGEVFLPGEIVKYRDFSSYAATGEVEYGVIGLFDIENRAARGRERYANSDYGDNCEFVIDFDPDTGTLGHDHWCTFEVERCDESELPENQRVLARIGEHISGGARLTDEEIATLDDTNFFYWDDELIEQVRAEKEWRK
jgi:hypothetical protein